MLDLDEISLLGEKMRLLKMLNHCQDELNKINKKLDAKKKKQMFKILKGKKK
tara:strand:+ start:2443 stop:2598 length:156 start_codon:yes stop_codon:yes gene_type:complete